MDGTENTETVVEVDYSQQALENVEGLVGDIDFGVFMSMFVLVIGATAGVTVGITALKKGWSWIKGAIKRAGA